MSGVDAEAVLGLGVGVAERFCESDAVRGPEGFIVLGEIHSIVGGGFLRPEGLQGGFVVLNISDFGDKGCA